MALTRCLAPPIFHNQIKAMERYFIRVDYSPAPESVVIETFKNSNEIFSDAFSVLAVEPGVFSISSTRIMDLYKAGIVGGVIATFYPSECEQSADAQQDQPFDNARP